MQTRAVVITGRWVRLVLLFCTLVGLAAMHTLGHGAHATGAHPADHAARSAARSAMPAPAMVDPAVPGQALAAPVGPSGGDLPGWSVCLAVLGAFAVVLLVAVLLRRRPVGVRPGPGSPPASGPRAPPPRPVGLRLATASVLRR